MQGNLLEIKGLNFSFAREDVLRGISLTVRQGEFVSIVGPSGCGKTLLLRLLAGLQEARPGDIIWPSTLKRPTLGMAFQRDALFPWLTLEENLSICIGASGLSKAQRKFRSIELLKSAGLELFCDHRPHEVSGGMAQKANVLRAFASNPALVLMDEPFVHLDYIQRNELHDFTTEIWKERKSTIVFVSHDIDETLLLSDRVFVMTSKPTQVAEVLEIDLPRPRTPESVRKEPRYLEHYSRIMGLLSRRSGRGGLHE